MKTISLLIALFVAFPCTLISQQVSDEDYNPDIPNPEYQRGEGPVIFIDEGHHNFHTKNGRYLAFSNLLIRDGYNVLEYKGPFETEKLAKAKILVISNALNEKNEEDWYIPVLSAFTNSEIKIVKDWVYGGGSLFLIADHMPMAGAASDLAKVFGFEFTNGFAIDTLNRGAAFFSVEEKMLTESVITRGRNSNESVGKIASFTGQAFKIPSDASPILTFNNSYINLLPDTAWVFDKNTPIHNLEGWSQGAFKTFGKGKVVVFGEAAMFTAQLAGPNKIKIGMNSDVAPENYLLLLNIIHWLDGKMP